MSGVVEHIVHGAVLDDLARVHDRHVIRHARHDAQVVGDENDSHAVLPLQVAQQVENLCLDGDVQRRGRLIRDQDRRFAGDGHGDHRPLQHAARELEGILQGPLLRFRDTGHRQQFNRSRQRLLARSAPVHLQGLGDLGADGHGGVQRGHGVLEDHADLRAADAPAVDLRTSEDLRAAQSRRPGGDAARRHRDQPHHALHGHRFSTTGFTDDRQGFTGLNVETDAAHRLYDAAVGVELDPQPVYFKQCIHRASRIAASVRFAKSASYRQNVHSVPRMRASSASRSPSPSRLKASTVMLINTAGKISSWG